MSRKPPDSIEMTRPDDWHLHLRDGEMLSRILPYTARRFGRAVVMPNLESPIRSVAEAMQYRKRILTALPSHLEFEPLMALYLTDSTSIEEVAAAANSPCVIGFKLYPMGATTNSEYGVSEIETLHPILEALERFKIPLLVHGEATSPACDVFDRERLFLEDSLQPMIERFEGLRVVFEHITTAEAAAFVAESPERVAATITPQHLLLTRNAIFEGGLRPHLYCLPVLKRERDREALVRAATGGDASFFLGTDSAPHARSKKETACGCAGIFSAPIALEAYAEVFHQANSMDRFEGFASFHGPDYYRRPRNKGRIRLDRVQWYGPDQVGDGDEAIEVFWAGKTFQYRVRDVDESKAVEA